MTTLNPTLETYQTQKIKGNGRIRCFIMGVAMALLAQSGIQLLSNPQHQMTSGMKTSALDAHCNKQQIVEEALVILLDGGSLNPPIPTTKPKRRG